MDKYFAEYHSLPAELATNMGKFSGNIDRMGCNFFAGIKVYPPLGFDPWLEGDEEEMAKVKYLYQYCSAKRIPITAHCNSGGFMVIDLITVLMKPTIKTSASLSTATRRSFGRN